MMKFLAQLQPGKIDILNDRIDTDPNRLYLLDHKKLEKKYDFIIASAHDPNAFSYKKENKLIVVISHIPDMKSDAWPGFYVNLCMCDAIACDSFVRAELSKMTYPDKRVFLLDGCTPLHIVPPTLNMTQKINIVSLDTKSDFWVKFSRFILQSEKFTVSNTIGANSVGIAFHPMGGALATNMSHKLFHIMVQHSDASIYLDSRSNHYLGSRLANLVNMGGEAPNKPFKDAFELLLEDLLTLLEHSAKKPIVKFASSHNVFDRIFHEINKTDM